MLSLLLLRDWQALKAPCALVLPFPWCPGPSLRSRGTWFSVVAAGSRAWPERISPATTRDSACWDRISKGEGESL